MPTRRALGGRRISFYGIRIRFYNIGFIFSLYFLISFEKWASVRRFRAASAARNRVMGESIRGIVLIYQHIGRNDHSADLLRNL
jgi:hypothetical protein